MGRNTGRLRQEVISSQGYNCAPKIKENYPKIKKKYFKRQQQELKSIIYAHMLAYVRFFLYLCRLKYFTYD